jgi:periplasmic protein TonB
MDFFEELKRDRYGSFELKRQIGPNLLKGLLISLIINGTVVASPFIVKFFLGEQEVTAPRQVRFIPPSELFKLLPEERHSSEPIQPSVPDDPVASNPVIVPGDPLENQDLPAISQIDIKDRLRQRADSSTSGSGTGGDSLVVMNEPPPADSIPDPGFFVPFEIPPAALKDFSPTPDYPALAKLSGSPGKVFVNVFIDTHGDVKRYAVISVDPAGLGFDDEVLKVIPKWRFTPAIQQGRPVGVWVTIPFRFKLK